MQLHRVEHVCSLWEKYTGLIAKFIPAETKCHDASIIFHLACIAGGIV